MAKRYNIVLPKKYEQNGEEKTQWLPIGTLVRFPPTEDKDEGYILELNMFPNLKLKVFEQKKKEETEARPKKKTVSEDESLEDVSADSVPC